MAMTKGQNLIGRVMGSCVLESVLGYGGSSAVFLAQQQQPERKVAVKVFLPRNGVDGQMPKDFYQRFLREAEAASKLDHPNILPVYAYGQQDGLPYIVMPYMPGGTLADYIQRHGALSLQEAVWYLEQIAAALDYAHEQGCVHCDVKPANVLLDSDGLVRLSDFGIARVSQDSEKEARALARTSDALAGTPDYISPEQALGQTVDGRSDIYSMAITLFYLLAKQLPFYADTPIALALSHVHKPPPSLARIRSDVTEEIDSVLYKALAKKPDDRYQTLEAFSRDFAQAVEEAKRSGAASSKRAVVLVRSTGQLSGPLSHAIASDQPPQPRRSLVQRVGLVRLLCLAFFMFSLLVSGSFVTVLALSRANNHPTTKVSTALDPPKGTTSRDLLVDHDGWPSNATFFYDDGKYHIRDMSRDNMSLALYHPDQPGNFSNFHLTVTMSQVHRPDDESDYQTDFYGVVFRASSDQTSYYLFEIDPANGKQYMFMRYEGGLHWDTLANGTIPALNDDPGKNNTLSIQAQGNSFVFMVNDKPVGKTISDTFNKQPLLAGLIGLYVENKGSEVAFSHLYVDPLK
ncbi:MAG TPA: protein kinase [Ktedonobacteraceae bacterium]|jgi:tRNA A-37 threonylcarbamoyl transferase component Bud32|nr:protein kinase [Ktedonobacteraceae bacterium]